MTEDRELRYQKASGRHMETVYSKAAVGME